MRFAAMAERAPTIVSTTPERRPTIASVASASVAMG